MNSITDDLLSLRFASGPVESMYLNEDRIEERFISHLGAITSWTRSARNEAGAGVNLEIVGGDKRKAKSDELTYDLHAALARALVLRTALQAENVIRPSGEAGVGQYVVASGAPCLRSPHFQSDHEQGCIADTDVRYQSLEADRARQEAMRLALAGPGGTNDLFWLLMLTDGDELTAASVLNSRWINDAVVSYVHMNMKWTIFGTLRERISGVPTLAAIHVWIDMDQAMAPTAPV
jgi:hypothetical protein